MTGNTKITADAVKSLITRRHDTTGGEWAVFLELRNGTGWVGQTRSIDVFAMNTWPSGKFRRVGYEVKISRSDFLREMKDPDKRAWAMEVCNEFWFAAPSGVIQPGELPDGCGLLIVTQKGGGLRTIKVAPQRDVRDLDMREMAAIARQSCHSEFLSGVRWRFAGREITDEELGKIVTAERSYLEQDEFQRRVEKAVEQKMDFFGDALRSHAEALKSAGCEPPPWMLNGSLHFMDKSTHQWSAEAWVRANVSPGPALSGIETAKREVEFARKNIEAACQAIEKLGNSA